MTHIALYAAGEGQDDVYLSPVTVPGSGTFQLTHTVDFQPTAALVLGISFERISATDGLPRWHLMMFANDNFAANSFGHPFSDLFPSDFVPHLDRRLRHMHLAHRIMVVSACTPELHWVPNLASKPD